MGAAAAAGGGVIVLGLSIGQSAVYAVVSLVAKLTRGPLGQQTATLNPSRSTRELLDLTYQLLGIGFALVPVALALWLLSEPGRSAVRRIGLDAASPGRDLAVGAALAAVIGVPGLALYLAGQALGITAIVVPSALGTYWWSVPVLVLAAAQNALLEEVVGVAYLVERLQRLGWGVPGIILAGALLRGTYHAYQGFGAMAGNAVMGVVFMLVYLRTRRVMPLVVAHTLLDVVAFAGYHLLGDVLDLPG
ncbi:CPBP family intramembrane glutamic endopeptidase [Quadrisphaera sp. GCM10027208]|uniref:CPBP family intramembrane glutamic endopeptidase n=1 Tax=Quadrisphaera sp. GCM10027208 TaxID=3273423 RepID=UPI0036062E27